ncbi:MAG: hypothetical protein ACP5XB_07010 [Isosphaeraceae bacterium]
MFEARYHGALGKIGLGWLLIVVLGGCEGNTPLEEAGVSLSVPSSWKSVEPQRWEVPGTPLAAWSGPEGSSLVIYQSLPDPGGTARSIAEGRTNLLANLPELSVRVHRTETIAEETAARVEVVAPGSGAALAPSGVGTPLATEGKPLVSTHQVTIGFPRSRGTLFLSWHTPEQAHDRLAPEIGAMLQSLKLRPDAPQSTSHY